VIRKKVARWATIVGITTATVLLTYYIYYPYSLAGRQAANMAKAREHLPKVEAITHTDERFALITPGVSTARMGCLVLTGYVQTDGDRQELQRLVEGTAPPVTVVFAVQVAPSPAFDELRKLSASKATHTGNSAQ
jgi:hypothetical protein